MLGGSRAKVARAENKRGQRPSFKIVRWLVRSAAATFEIRSNLFKNVHQKGNRRSGRGSAGCAPPPQTALQRGNSNSPRAAVKKELRKTQKFQNLKERKL